MIASYRDLLVWQRAMELVYKLAAKLPREENYGLASQLQRAVVSIPSNIAEGHARESGKEYLRYLLIACGSMAELETQVLLCARLCLTSDNEIAPVLDCANEIGKMIRGLQHSLNEKLIKGD
ncbi:MAG: four helix bundle protein [Betaproteobacteria bacterium]